MNSFRSDAGPHSRRTVNISIGWPLLIFVILICALLIGLGLLRRFSQSRAASQVESTVVIEIKYNNPGASEVFMNWGINGWQVVPEELRTSETTISDNGLMQTLLNPEEGMFTGRLVVPPWSTFQYGFLITATKHGQDVSIWEGREEFELHVGETDRLIEVLSAVDLIPEQTPSGAEAEE